MTIQERIQKVLIDIEKCFPEELDKIKNILGNIHDEPTLIRELESLEQKIEKHKKTYTNTYYSNEENETYYADVEEDNYVYDAAKPEESAIIEESLEEATKDYIDVAPQREYGNGLIGKIKKHIDLTPKIDIHDEKEYGNFIYGDVVWDDQIGYRVIENENGLFHVIQKESSYFIYPSKRLNLNNPEHVDLCNDLFKCDRKKGFIVGDEIELDNVEPAEIFMPFVSVIDDQLNQTTYSDVLIGEGIGLDETFKDGLIKDVEAPKVENKLTKGKISVKSIEHEGFTFQEEIILEPVKYIDGTFIPYPREQKTDESINDYTNFLIAHYNRYGYTVEFDKDGKPIYPHETEKEVNETIESQETFDDKFGIRKFLESRYNFEGDIANLEVSVMLAYLKAYKEYLKIVKTSNPEALEYIDENLKATEEAIEDIKEQKLFL